VATVKAYHPLRKVLERHGISWNRKTAQLVELPWVTEEYVKAHVKARPEHLGLVITLMLQGAPAPEVEDEWDYWENSN
jgi:hypothetical protein